jgi:hypothetical protein
MDQVPGRMDTLLRLLGKLGSLLGLRGRATRSGPLPRPRGRARERASLARTDLALALRRPSDPLFCAELPVRRTEGTLA